MIAARALLGTAGATLAPSTLALISNMFRDPKQRGLAIGVWLVCFMSGAAIGPLVGGVMLEDFWWGSVFLLGVPAMLLLLVLGPALLPEYRDTNAGRLDLASVALSLAAILPIVYGLKELAKAGWHSLPVAAIVAGLVFGTVFVRRQRSLADPMLDVRSSSSKACHRCGRACGCSPRWPRPSSVSSSPRSSRGASARRTSSEPAWRSPWSAC